MYERGHYPTRNGIAISPYELELPRSETFETNNHHGEYIARLFGKNVLLLMVRNLACEQTILPIDQHNWLHYNFDTPKMPTMIQAMDKIEEQLDCGGLLKVKHKGKGYTERPLTDEDFQRCKDFYDSLKR